MKNIFLIGMPSSGKSTLGKRLARALHYRFVDTDRIIVREEGLPISTIFARHGEAYFRAVESRVLHTVKPGNSLVVSTGGGMPCFHNNMTYIRATGISVFLDVPVEMLYQRMLSHATADRPLYDHADPALLDTLRQRYELRLPFYQQADIIITGETNEQAVLERLGDWL